MAVLSSSISATALSRFTCIPHSTKKSPRKCSISMSASSSSAEASHESQSPEKFGVSTKGACPKPPFVESPELSYGYSLANPNGSSVVQFNSRLIDLLPTSKHKSGGIFSRKKSEDRCVICQMRYKRGDRQINLPCKHAYHTHCGSKWLRINKTCPVCNTVVFGDDQHNDLTK